MVTRRDLADQATSHLLEPTHHPGTLILLHRPSRPASFILSSWLGTPPGPSQEPKGYHFVRQGQLVTDLGDLFSKQRTSGHLGTYVHTEIKPRAPDGRLIREGVQDETQARITQFSGRTGGVCHRSPAGWAITYPGWAGTSLIQASGWFLGFDSLNSGSKLRCFPGTTDSCP